MQPYGNLDGNSGIAEYELAPGRIFIRFVGGPKIYEYDHAHPGAWHVRQMKAHAKAGRDLATYINQHVRDNYAHAYASEAELRAALRTQRSDKDPTTVRPERRRMAPKSKGPAPAPTQAPHPHPPPRDTSSRGKRKSTPEAHPR
jgi:hypothetical protein